MRWRWCISAAWTSRPNHRRHPSAGETCHIQAPVIFLSGIAVMSRLINAGHGWRRHVVTDPEKVQDRLIGISGIDCRRIQESHITCLEELRKSQPPPPSSKYKVLSLHVIGNLYQVDSLFCVHPSFEHSKILMLSGNSSLLINTLIGWARTDLQSALGNGSGWRQVII